MMVIHMIRLFLTSLFGFTNILCFSDLRFSKRASIIIIAALSIISAVSIILLNEYAKDFMTTQWLILFVIQLGIIVAVGFILGKHNGLRTLSSVTIAAVYNQVGAVITLSFARIIPNKVVLLVIYAVVYISLCCLAFFLVRKPLIALMRLNRGGWLQFFLLSLFVYIVMIIIVPLPSSGSNASFNIIVGLMLSLSIIWVFVFLRHELSQSKIRGTIEKSKLSIEFQVYKLQRQVSQMEDNEKSLAKLRHDLKHNFLMLAHLAASRDFDGCNQILSTLDSSVSQLEISAMNEKFCKNRFINAAISSYAELYQKAGIDLNVEILLDNPNLDIYLELAVVIGNCLDNSLAAAKAVLSAKGSCAPVTLRCFPAGEQAFLEIVNPFVGTITFDKKTGVPLSDKAGHGIGSVSTKSFSEKYNAPLSWIIDGENFITRIVF